MGNPGRTDADYRPDVCRRIDRKHLATDLDLADQERVKGVESWQRIKR